MAGNEGRDMYPANLVHETAWIAKLTRRLDHLRSASVDGTGDLKSPMTSSANLSREEPDA
jgi:hypothetical protein